MNIVTSSFLHSSVFRPHEKQTAGVFKFLLFKEHLKSSFFDELLISRKKLCMCLSFLGEKNDKGSELLFFLMLNAVFEVFSYRALAKSTCKTKYTQSGKIFKLDLN